MLSSTFKKERIFNLFKLFLRPKDLFHLIQVNQSLRDIFSQILVIQLERQFNNFLNLSIKNLAQIQNQPKCFKKFSLKKYENGITIIKMSLNNFPTKYLTDNIWRLSNSLIMNLFFDKSNPLDKLHQSNTFFLSSDGNTFLSLNRSLVDPNLDHNHQLKMRRDENIKDTLEQLSQSNQFLPLAGDFTMQQILQRQRDILTHLNKKKEQFEEQKQQKENPSLKFFQKIDSYGIILCHGGYFSIGIFDLSGKCIFHKSDHKYVKRCKQGQRQLNKDSNSGSSVKSMGSQIRRDQEKKHQQNVKGILKESFELLSNCSIILLQAPGLNYQILIEGEADILFKLKNKIRSMCLTAKKANYTEVERIQKAITTLYIVHRENNDNFF